MAPLACQLLVSVFLLTFLQEFHIVSSQRRYSEVGDPFGGVRYSNSRVASTVTRRYPIGTNATERPRAAYVQTTTAPSPYWTTATTTPSPTTGDDDGGDDDVLWWASSSTDTTTTEKPKRRTQRKKADRETLADWRNRFSGTWAGTASRRRPTSTTSEFTPIEEGSYYDRPNTSAAPAKLVDVSEKPVFNWEGRRHRHRHGHGQRVGPDTAVTAEQGGGGGGRRQEFKARTATTYTTPPTVAATTTTTTPRPTATYGGVRPSTVDPAKTRGSVWYHNKKDKPPVTHRRLSESVTYVSGSYFPHSDRLRRPVTGFFRSRNELPDDNASPPPEILTYPTTRTRTIRIRYFPGDHGRSGTRNQDEDRDDSVHPFASVYGK